MHQIGQNNVPEALWLRLVEYCARQFTDVALYYAEGSVPVDLTEARKELNSAIPQNIKYLKNCVIALIRIQTDNYTGSDEEITSSDNYENIWRAANLAADQICYSALLPGSQLKGIVDNNWQDIANIPSSI